MTTAMARLEAILVFKIVVTMCLWCGPLLFLPMSFLDALGIRAGTAGIFLRLLGIAYGSLLVNYSFGLAAVRNGRYPSSSVWTGIVSNSGAFLLLVLGAIDGAWATWGNVAGGLMWTSLVATGCITAGLVLFGPLAQARRAKKLPS